MIVAFLTVGVLGVAPLGAVPLAASSSSDVVVSRPITVRPAGGSDRVGYSVAVSGDTVVVGAPFRTINGHGGRGEVLVFVKPTGGWQHARPTAVLTASDGAPRSVLGLTVGVSGRTIVAGEPFRQVGSSQQHGVIYVFTEPKGGWHSETQTAELHASDGGSYNRLAFATGSLVISGDTIVAGAPGHSLAGSRGAAYVFTKPRGGWHDATETAELTSATATRGQAFGASVSLAGSAIAVGAPSTTAGGGSVYVFRRTSSGWRTATPNATLTASSGIAGNDLGTTVAVSRETIVASARIHHRVANDDRNVLYVFAKPAGEWRDATETAILNETSSREGDDLGQSLAITGNTIFAGDPSHKLTPNYSPGAAYLYARPKRGWRNAAETRRLVPAGPSENEGFGRSVAISGSTMVIGAPGYTATKSTGPGQGRVYVLSLTPAARTLPK